MSCLKTLFSLILIITVPAVAQKLRKEDKILINNLQTHISFLADDKLEGRRIGTNGEKLAMDYIKSQFEKAGLEPKGDDGSYFQAFEIWEGRNFDKNSYLHINGEEVNTNEFFPLPCSPKTNLASSPSIALKEAGVPWFLDVKDDVNNAKNNPHFNLMTFLAGKAKSYSSKGATALFVYNSDPAEPEEEYDPKQKMDPTSIPIVMVSGKIAKKYFADETATLIINLKIAFEANIRTGHNVIAYLNNKAATTIMLGAHFDHIGLGEDGNSLDAAAGHLIHNGADDNASGIAALIELSRLLKKSDYKNNNYLFLAFSGEELGLFGSKYFVDHPTIDMSQANCMLNMDMVGRLNESTKTLIVGGYGTSPLWPPLFNNLRNYKNITVKFDSSGTGASDHTSFYRKNIPVLFFFTGLHSDYHKATDDADKINYTGENFVIQFIYKIIEYVNRKGKVVFTPTIERPTGTMATFSVTMGIMPDYTFNGIGVKVDGISEGRPAQKAGLAEGDIIIQLGDYPVSSLEEYMQALNKFKKGDKTKVTVKRIESTVEAEVTF
ncbi:MAG: M20/M25/M40 family metallo-hydrolase [Chitinophagaceae bacterium]